jgi:secreted PhoX family phosphatase
LRALGRFYREAVAVDPGSGCVYQTEDRDDGLLYRFVPDSRGELARGGRLQALRIRDAHAAHTGNARGAPVRFAPAAAHAVDWVDLDAPDSPDDDLRLRGFARGAARFVRGEGIVATPDGMRICCTEGGAAGIGQIFRYRPSPHEGTAEEARDPGRLDLVYESTDREVLRNPDNLTLAPWGDLFVCEDAPDGGRLLSIDAQGSVRVFARQHDGDSEFAGVCFAPDGDWLFVNLQHPGVTFAIRGPWATVRTRG